MVGREVGWLSFPKPELVHSPRAEAGWGSGRDAPGSCLLGVQLPGSFLSCSACRSLNVTLGSEEADGHTLGGPSGPVPLVVV